MACGVGARWTEAEYQAIREHYPSRGVRWEGWSELLNDRSPEAIQRVASMLGVHREDNGRGWSAEEEQALRDNFPAHIKTWDGWAKVLPNRTWPAITKRANTLGLHHDASASLHTPWSEAEDAALEALWPHHRGSWEGWKAILPGRSYTAICSRGPLVMERKRTEDECEAVEELKRYQADWTTEQTRELLQGLAAIARATGHTPAEVLQKGCELCRRAERERERETNGK